MTRSLDAHEVTISAVIFIALLSSLLTTLPLTPGGAGLVEGAVVLAMTLFVDNHNLAVSISPADRLINYWSLIAGGIIHFQWAGVTVVRAAPSGGKDVVREPTPAPLKAGGGKKKRQWDTPNPGRGWKLDSGRREC